VSSATYDLVDLYFEMGERLPGELACCVFEQLRREPHRLDGRCVALVGRIVESWKVRFPITGEVEEVVSLLKPRTRELSSKEAGAQFEELNPEDIPLIHLVTSFTKGTRPTPDFAAKFKFVNARIMPHVISIFNVKRP
jgi:hypothetical protein